MEENVDYKELYLKMMRASERAIRILIEAQRECEARYLQAGGSQEEASPAKPPAVEGFAGDLWLPMDAQCAPLRSDSFCIRRGGPRHSVSDEQRESE